jgi:hypothetical protein
MDIVGAFVLYFVVALFAFWLDGMIYMDDYERSVSRSLRKWKEAKRYNRGDLRSAQKEREAAITLIRNIFFWGRAFVWPLILPGYIVIWVSRFVRFCFSVANSIRKPKGYDQA